MGRLAGSSGAFCRASYFLSPSSLSGARERQSAEEHPRAVSDPREGPGQLLDVVDEVRIGGAHQEAQVGPQFPGTPLKGSNGFVDVCRGEVSEIDVREAIFIWGQASKTWKSTV